MALNNEIALRRVVPPMIIAAVLWFFMFNPWTVLPFNFWIFMALAGCILISSALVFDHSCFSGIKVNAKAAVVGILLAVVLWCIFWIGDKVASWIFPFAADQVAKVYTLKDGENPVMIMLLLLFVIGPAEEIFWRGFVQRNLGRRFNANIALVATTLIYALVHIWSFNFMLIMAALVAGAFWGLLYRYNPKSLFALVVSHAVWDIMVFILFPI